MKKFVFFKSSTSSNGTSNLASPQSKEKQLHSKNSTGDGRNSNQAPPKPRSKKVAYDNQSSPFLRKSRSHSSGTVHDSGLLRTQRQSDSRSSRRALTPERHSRAKWFEDTAISGAPEIEKCGAITFARSDNVSLESSSHASTNASNKGLDRYIDGEQHQERSPTHKVNPNTLTHVGQSNGGGKRPSRVQNAEQNELMVLRAELTSRTRKLEKEKNELQLALEKELDRWSMQCSMKLEKYRTEEHRLQERVRELAEQNVALQREVSWLREKDLTLRMEEPTVENQNLHKNLSELQDGAKSDLKAEALITSLLREKLYSKEVDVEQLQAELATAVRGNDILRCELQNAMDNLSCITHKMKDLEIQVIKKDESMYRLEEDLQYCKRELQIVNGILPKVAEERDMMWEEVKQFSEKEMLLTCEIAMLKKKVETLDEDVLLKEGQIAILKDALGKPFDLLSSPLSNTQFLLQ